MPPRVAVTSVIVVILGLAWALSFRGPLREVSAPAVGRPAPSAADEEGNVRQLSSDSTASDPADQWRTDQAQPRAPHRSDPVQPRAATRRAGNPIGHANPPSPAAAGAVTPDLAAEAPGQTASNVQQATSQASRATSEETLPPQVHASNGPDTDGVLTAAAPGPSRDPVLRPPSVLTGAPPDYPAGGYQVVLSRSRLTPQLQVEAAEGRVVLRLLVLVNGTVDRVNVADSSGFDALDRAAVVAVSTWRFTPATRDGEPIEAWVVIPVRFVIQ